MSRIKEKAKKRSGRAVKLPKDAMAAIRGGLKEALQQKFGTSASSPTTKSLFPLNYIQEWPHPRA